MFTLGRIPLVWSDSTLSLWSSLKVSWILMDARISMNINQLQLNRVCIQKASVITPPLPHPLCFSCLISHNLLSHRFWGFFCTLTSILIRYKIKLDSDHAQYGGHGRLDHNTEFFTEANSFNGRANSMQVNMSSFSFFAEFILAASLMWSALHFWVPCIYCQVCSRAPILLPVLIHFTSSFQPKYTFTLTKSLN